MVDDAHLLDHLLHLTQKVARDQHRCQMCIRDRNNAVRGVSFNVRAGEIVCVAGIDGNGQSELIYGITGLEKPTSGTIKLEGKDITSAPIRERSKAGMSHIPEDRHKHGLVLRCV